MADEKNDLSRRDFVALSLAACNKPASTTASDARLRATRAGTSRRSDAIVMCQAER